MAILLNVPQATLLGSKFCILLPENKTLSLYNQLCPSSTRNKIPSIKAVSFQTVTFTVLMLLWYKVILKQGTVNLNITQRIWKCNCSKNTLIRFYRSNTLFWNKCAQRMPWKMVLNCKCQSCKKQRFKSSLCIHRSMTQSPYLEYDERTFKDKNVSGPKFPFTSFNYLETSPFFPPHNIWHQISMH